MESILFQSFSYYQAPLLPTKISQRSVGFRTDIIYTH